MIKKGIGVTMIFIISTFIQLISQIIITRIFGATLNLDIFLAAVALPTIFVTVIYGTLSDVFLPLFGEKRVKDPSQANHYFITHLFILGFIFFLIALLMNFLAQPLSALLYQSRGEEFVKQVATQMNFMFYSLPLSVVATLLGSYFYTQKKFIRFPLAQLIGSIANLLMIILLAPSMGIWALVFAFVVNIFFQILFVIPKELINKESEIDVSSSEGLPNGATSEAWEKERETESISRQNNLFSFHSLNLLPIFIAWIPLIIGNFALRSDALLIRSFGSSLSEGYLVYLNLVAKIFSLATSVMTIGIQVLLLPHLVEYFANKEYERAIRNVNKAKLIAIGISVLVTIVLALIAPIAINLLFVGNKFTQQDAQTTISLLPFFILPAIGWGINSVFFQPLLALKKTFQLGLINLIALGLGWGIGILVKDQFGALPGITTGLIVLLFSGIIGSELLWQHYKKQLRINNEDS
ncbi:MAG TPA: lipid II flippase MurJ [Candidatus Nitrosocosmicus sp.]|nr:lipid II flippase MurJ [Candidatus Nitrosocosmicus sp.]